VGVEDGLPAVALAELMAHFPVALLVTQGQTASA
jgi:hypothetical protein